MIEEERSERSDVADFEDGGRDPRAKKCGKSKVRARKQVKARKPNKEENTGRSPAQPPPWF